MKKIYEKYREVILYLTFGVLTTVVSFGAYFAILWSWQAAFDLPAEDHTSSLYWIGYTIATVIQWVTGVLFAFFTNRKWVFTDADPDASLWKQLCTFSAGRVATLFVDYGVTYAGTWALTALFPSLIAVMLLGMELNFCEIIAKLVAAVIVVVTNYVISKLFVFKKKK